MPHTPVHFQTRVVRGGKHILAQEQARARKLLAGLHPHGPHGPLAFHLRKSGHHHHHRHDGNVITEPPREVPPAVDPLASGHSIDVTDTAVTYTVPVGIGQPPETYKLLIDTGSSNTWVGAGKPYKPTSTSKNTHHRVNVSYGSGSFTGTEYTDTVLLNEDLVGDVCMTLSSYHWAHFPNRIGPVDLTTGSSTVPTLTDNLFNQKTIGSEVIGISYTPTTQVESIANGELNFGETDPPKYTGELTYVPITQTSPASKYWGIDQTIMYGGKTKILEATAGIVDTGTTLLLLATDAFKAYQEATGAVMDSTTGLLTVTEEQFAKMESMFFRIGPATYELTPNAQIWPRALDNMLGGEDGKIYLVTADLGSNSGSGLDSIDGFVFLQRLYSVYDTTNSRVGLATTQFTNATSN
ncbi:hypothetical protein AX17_006686 [Amanita inopinata Kibby_2008]|nr:hypothetical protein AX17_006686 [Amanita inopinata Kibby_2008]